jgi:hypothetical protein
MEKKMKRKERIGVEKKRKM